MTRWVVSGRPSDQGAFEEVGSWEGFVERWNDREQVGRRILVDRRLGVWRVWEPREYEHVLLPLEEGEQLESRQLSQVEEELISERRWAVKGQERFDISQRHSPLPPPSSHSPFPAPEVSPD
jgi:hypothetical protein